MYPSLVYTCIYKVGCLVICIYVYTCLHGYIYACTYIYIYAYFLWWRILWALYDIIYHLHNITNECPYNIIILWCWILNALCNILPFYHVCCFYLKCVLCITIIMCFVSNDEIKMFNQSMMSQRAPCRLKSSASRLFAQRFVQTHIKGNIEAPCH